MANGVEQRFPFLDSLVTKYAFSLENNLLMNKKKGKVILKQIFKDVLPLEVIQRKKQGYLAPDDEVVRYMLKFDKFDGLLTSENLKKTDIFDFDFVLNLRQKVLKGEDLKDFEVNALIFVISTQLLYEIFIEKRKIN